MKNPANSIDTSLIANLAELVDQIKKGKRDAYEFLYGNYAPALYGIISRLIPDQQLAEELLKATFLRVCSQSENYEASKMSLFTWLAINARKLCLEKIRNHNSSLAKSFPTEHQALPEYHQADVDPILQLIYFQGKTPAEVSELLQIPVDIVKVRLRKAIAAWG